MGERARLFVAAELPADAARDLAGWARDCAGSDPALRLLAPEDLHVTLAFLGSLPVERIPDVAGALVDPPRGPVAFDDLVWLPVRRPGVLAIDLEDPSGALGAVRTEAVQRLVAALPGQWEPEVRPFRAHVTVARVRRGVEPRTRELPRPPPGSFVLPSVALLRSRLGDGAPARYEVLARRS